MTIQQLEYIVAVDNYKHFGKAALACGITQPTLSLMIKKLEEELDVTIFRRDSHPVRATEMGEKVLERARMVLLKAGELVEMTKSEKELSSGELNIGMISTVAPVLVPGLFMYILKKHPSVQPVIQEMQTENIKTQLHKGQLDMGIVASPADDADLVEIPLYREGFLAYVSPDNPLHKQSSLDSATLLDHPLWIMKKGLRLFDKSLLAEGETFSYEQMYEGGRAGTLIYIVNSIGGITLVPESHVHLILYSMQSNLRPIVGASAKRTVSLVLRKDYFHETMMNIIVDAVRNTIPAEMQHEMIKSVSRLKL